MTQMKGSEHRAMATLERKYFDQCYKCGKKKEGVPSFYEWIVTGIKERVIYERQEISKQPDNVAGPHGNDGKH